MKFFLIVTLLFFCACSNDAPQKPQDVVLQEGEASFTKNDTLCFIYTEGKKQQDTQAVKLLISGNDVEGKMIYMPEEKDWRFGTLKGKKTNDILSLKWTFVQEGIKDSADVIFKLDGDKLLQKSVSYDVQTGREMIADTASFTKAFEKINCENFPKQDFDMGL